MSKKGMYQKMYQNPYKKKDFDIEKRTRNTALLYRKRPLGILVYARNRLDFLVFQTEVGT